MTDQEHASRPQMRLLPNPDAAIHENNLARAAIWWLVPDLQVPIWEAFEFGGFSAIVTGIPADLGPMSLADALVLVALETMWGEQSPESRAENRVTYAIGEIWGRLGHAARPNAFEVERVRKSLLRLTYAKVERQWVDAEGTGVHQIRGIIADADFYKRGQPGRFGTRMRGWIRFSPELHRQLSNRQIAYALDLPTLLALTPLAQRLYLFLAADQMRPMAGRPDFVTFTYPLGPRFYQTLGITDTNPRRIRAKLVAAGREIMALEPNYARIEVEPQRGKKYEWKAVVVRRKGRARAPSLRAAARATEHQVSARAALPSPAEIGPAGTPKSVAEIAAAKSHADRRTTAAHDPRVLVVFDRWVAEAEWSATHELAWREYRRDLIDWITGGEVGPAPKEPDLPDPTAQSVR